MRVDVHNHAVPEQAIALLNGDPVYAATVSDGMWRGAAHPDFPLVDSFVDPEAKVAELEAAGLEGAVVSASPPLFYYHVDADAGEAMARAVNAGPAEMAAARPERLSWMATVPLQAPDRAVAVLDDARAAGCVGVEVGTAAGPEQPLDDPALEPFWDAAERAGLPVMLHPAYTRPHPRLGDYYLENVIGSRSRRRSRSSGSSARARSTAIPACASCSCTPAATSHGRRAACATPAPCAPSSTRARPTRGRTSGRC